MSYGSDNGNTALAQRNTRIEEKIDREAVGQIAVSNAVGGVNFQTVVDLMEFAKLMAISGICVPNHLRGQPGACLAICMQAVEWRMSPYAVANKSYVVNDRISYESQLIHAVVEQRAPLVGRLRATYTGQGPTRKCIITGKIKDEDEPLVLESPTFAEIMPKNSPLWKTKPDLQLFYNASRDWARMYFPDLILGVYSNDEIEAPSLPPKSVVSRTDALAERFAQHPTDETRTIDTSTANLPSTEAAEEILNNAPRAPETQEVDTGGVEAEPPADELNLDSEGKFIAYAESIASRDLIEPKVYNAAIKELRLNHGIGGGKRADTLNRNKIAQAMNAGQWDWVASKIV